MLDRAIPVRRSRLVQVSPLRSLEAASNAIVVAMVDFIPRSRSRTPDANPLRRPERHPDGCGRPPASARPFVRPSAHRSSARRNAARRSLAPLSACSRPSQFPRPILIRPQGGGTMRHSPAPLVRGIGSPQDAIAQEMVQKVGWGGGQSRPIMLTPTSN